MTGLPLLYELGDIREKCSSYVKFKDQRLGQCLMMALYLGVHQRVRKPLDVMRVLMQTVCDHMKVALDEDELLDERVCAALHHHLHALARNLPIHRLQNIVRKKKERRTNHIFIVLDGIDHLSGILPLETWLPDTYDIPNVHWMATTSDTAIVKAFAARRWEQMSIHVESWDEDFREGLLQSVIKRHKPAVYREHIEKLKIAPLRMFPEFLNCSMDLLRMCTPEKPADALTEWCTTFESTSSLHLAVMKKWCADVPGAMDMLSLLSLAETGMYEHELMDLLGVPTRLSCSNWQDLTKIVEETTFVCCGIRSFISRCVQDLPFFAVFLCLSALAGRIEWDFGGISVQSTSVLVDCSSAGACAELPCIKLSPSGYALSQSGYALSQSGYCVHLLSCFGHHC